MEEKLNEMLKKSINEWWENGPFFSNSIRKKNTNESEIQVNTVSNCQNITNIYRHPYHFATFIIIINYNDCQFLWKQISLSTFNLRQSNIFTHTENITKIQNYKEVTHTHTHTQCFIYIYFLFHSYVCVF